MAGGACGGELSIKTEPYFESGLFHRSLIPEQGTEVKFTVCAEAEVIWQAGTNGLWGGVRLDPVRAIDQACLDVSVVVKGRRLFFPWFSERCFLRWANISAGGIKKENVARWRERGVLSLAHKYRESLAIQENDSEAWYKEYVDAERQPGIAINEVGVPPGAATHRAVRSRHGRPRKSKEREA